MLLESFRSPFGVITANTKPVSNWWSEVKSFETFSFLDRCRPSTEKNNMFAAILNCTKNGGPSFQTQTVAKRCEIIQDWIYFPFLFLMIAKTKATNDLLILVFWRFRQFTSYLIDTDIEKLTSRVRAPSTNASLFTRLKKIRIIYLCFSLLSFTCQMGTDFWTTTVFNRFE